MLQPIWIQLAPNNLSKIQLGSVKKS